MSSKNQENLISLRPIAKTKITDYDINSLKEKNNLNIEKKECKIKPKEMSNNKNEKNLKNNKIIFILLIIIKFLKMLSNNKQHLIEYNFSKISLKIKGTGPKKILGYEKGSNEILAFESKYFPDEVHINGEIQNIVNYTYNFELSINYVELIWNNSLNSSENMFRECRDIIELNFSDFVSSDLIKMGNMFRACKSLNSLDLSNFETSKVKEMNGLFFGCSLLTSINLSNFNFSKVNRVNHMFYKCIYLEYINIQNFEETKLTESGNILDEVPNNVVICINEENNLNKILPLIRNKTCSIIDCSENWKLKQKKIINETGVCVESCENSSNYLYEYNSKCYKNCSQGFDGSNKCKCESEKCLKCPSIYSIINLCISCNDNYYPKENDDTNFGEYINCYKNLEGYYLENNLYKLCYYRCKTCEINGNDTNHNCLTCKDDYSFEFSYNNYINCYNSSIYNYYSDSIKNDYISYITYFTNLNQYTAYTTQIKTTNNIYITEYYEQNEITTYVLINNENINQKFITTSSHSKVLYECLLNDTINNKCNFQDIKNNSEILNIIKNNINALYNPENGKSQIIQGENNFIFQITNAKNELELLQGEFLNNQNLSILDLGQCEITLKNVYNIKEEDSLIYLKQEKTNCKPYEKNIQYEVYEPYNFTKLNLSICDGNMINLYVKAELSEETRSIYEELKTMGYDMLDINDPFYQDICTPYKYSNNTDILLNDRIDYIYNNKDSQCQNNCQFSSYLSNSLYINCTCVVAEENTDEEVKFDAKKLYESFYDILKYSNFQILKCHNLIFVKKVVLKNIGSIIVIVNFLFYFICFAFFIKNGTVPLINKIKNLTDSKEEKSKSSSISISHNNTPKKYNILNKKKIKKKEKHSHPTKKKVSLKLRSNQMKNVDTKRKKPTSTKKLAHMNLFGESIKPKIINNSIKRNLSPSSKNVLDFTEKNENKIKVQDIYIEKEEKKKQFDAFELNNLEYEEAVSYDKRTFLQTYWDILSREHIIIFTFFLCNDYNILYIKYTRFIFLLATDMALNVFFFSDDSMHKVFLNYGKYNFIQQIPQIVYSTIITQLIEVFLCYLSLTDKYVYQIKNVNKPNEAKMILKILKCLKIKLIFFFVFTFIFFGFYWYVIAAFCSVYENTQLTFLKDSLLSFSLGLLYPLILYLIPSALRILSLRYTKKSLKCIYKLSDIIPFF